MPQGCDQFTDGFSSALLCIKGPLVSITIPFHPLTLSWPDQRSDDPKHGAAPKGTSARSGCFARPNPSSRDCEAAARIPKNRHATFCEIVFMIVARKPQAMPTLRMYKVNLGGVKYTYLLSTQAVHSPRFNGELWGKVRRTTKGCWIPSSTVPPDSYSSDKGRNATETAPSTWAQLRRQLCWL